jgi:hypothetical protein
MASWHIRPLFWLSHVMSKPLSDSIMFVTALKRLLDSVHVFPPKNSDFPLHVRSSSRSVETPTRFSDDLLRPKPTSENMTACALPVAYKFFATPLFFNPHPNILPPLLSKTVLALLMWCL